jgi:hypothetical protein
MGIPGWDSVAGAGWWATFWFWASLGSLLLLGISEFISHQYTERKDFLVEQEQTAEKQRHDEEMARVHRGTAQANERAAELAKETALLQYQLEQERQKRAQRLLTDAQKAAMISALRGTLSEVMLVTQNDPEAQALAIQLMSVFSEAGVKMYAHEPPREDKWFAPAGLIMYRRQRRRATRRSSIPSAQGGEPLGRDNGSALYVRATTLSARIEPSVPPYPGV